MYHECLEENLRIVSSQKAFLNAPILERLMGIYISDILSYMQKVVYRLEEGSGLAAKKVSSFLRTPISDN